MTDINKVHKAMKYNTILKKIFCMLFGLLLLTPVYGVSTNVNDATIGDYGTWLTPDNQSLLHSNMNKDITSLSPTIEPTNIVPIEAKIGLAFINAISSISNILDISLVRFAIILILTVYAFWFGFETYKMMTDGTGPKKLIPTLVKQGVVIVIWLMVLELGPAKLFMLIMGPISEFGSYISKFILDTILTTANAQLPDTCAAIHNYAISNMTENNIITADSAASIMCVPTRLSSFFYTTIAVGWKWIAYGFIHDTFILLLGVVFVCLFIYNAFNFAFVALGVIADIFLALLLLPFTAIAETTKQTTFTGIAGKIFNKFLGIFKTESLEKQMTRIIDAVIYFISLSIIIGLCATLLSYFKDTVYLIDMPSSENFNFMSILLVGCLVTYFASKAKDLAKGIGGTINTALGDQFKNDIKNTWGKFKDNSFKVYKAIKENS